MLLCYEGKHPCFQNWAAKLKAVALGQKGDGNRTDYSNHLSGPQFPSVQSRASNIIITEAPRGSGGMVDSKAV